MSSWNAVCVKWQEEWVAEPELKKQLNQTRIRRLGFLMLLWHRNNIKLWKIIADEKYTLSLELRIKGK